MAPMRLGYFPAEQDDMARIKGAPFVYMLLEKEDWKIVSDLASEIAAIIIGDMEAGADDDRTPSFEEADLYERLRAQIEFMELKYGPHPIILDTKADFAKNLDEQIRLKKEAISICLPDDFELRGNIERDLAELYFEEKNDLANAKVQIEASISDLEKGKDLDDLSVAIELRSIILCGL
jgi:hypothetical protein